MVDVFVIKLLFVSVALLLCCSVALLLCCSVALLLWFCFVLFCVCNMQVDFMRRLEEDITIKNIARICLHAMKNSSDFNFTSCVGFNLSMDRSHLLGEPIDGMRIIFALSKRGLARLKSQRKNEKRKQESNRRRIEKRSEVVCAMKLLFFYSIPLRKKNRQDRKKSVRTPTIIATIIPRTVVSTIHHTC
jgi:hypothetical protein